MSWFILKSALSGVIIAAIAEIARRSPVLAALLASLPLVSVLGMIWMWQEGQALPQIARHSEATFWLVLPSMPMFLVVPGLIRSGMGFWTSLLVGCAGTVALYLLLLWIGPKLGLRL